MSKRRIEIEITLKDNRKLTASLKRSQAKVLKVVEDFHPREISHLEIGALYKPEEWGKKRLEGLYNSSVENFGKDQADYDMREQVRAIEGAISSIVSNIKCVFRCCTGIAKDEIYLGFPFYCPVGGSRKSMRIHPSIKSITFEEFSN